MNGTIKNILTGSAAATAFIVIAVIIGVAIGITAGSVLIWAVETR